MSLPAPRFRVVPVGTDGYAVADAHAPTGTAGPSEPYEAARERAHDLNTRMDPTYPESGLASARAWLRSRPLRRSNGTSNM